MAHFQAKMSRLLIGLTVLLLLATTNGFASIAATHPTRVRSSFLLPSQQQQQQRTSSSSSSSALGCICIDCARVTNCKAYHFVESKHEQPHMTDDPTFTPREGSPTIHVNIRTVRTAEQRQEEVQRMWKEHKAETERAEMKGETHGEQVYDLTPHTVYEYDVVQCADFVQDKGCWVRNMPEEIRQANPHFVPT